MRLSGRMSFGYRYVERLDRRRYFSSTDQYALSIKLRQLAYLSDPMRIEIIGLRFGLMGWSFLLIAAGVVVLLRALFTNSGAKG